MPESYNYIKTRSRRELWNLIKKSKQIIFKAGTNDVDNQPGSTTEGNPTRNPTGVPQPGQYEPEAEVNKIVVERGRIAPSSFGAGNVDQPSEGKIKPLNTNDQIYHYPYIQSQNWRDRTLLCDNSLTPLDIHKTEAGSIENQPAGTNNAGELSKEPERTTGLDGNRIVRERQRKRLKETRRRSDDGCT